MNETMNIKLCVNSIKLISYITEFRLFSVNIDCQVRNSSFKLRILYLHLLYGLCVFLLTINFLLRWLYYILMDIDNL